jgi:hypothetical protein
MTVHSCADDGRTTNAPAEAVVESPLDASDKRLAPAAFTAAILNLLQHPKIGDDGFNMSQEERKATAHVHCNAAHLYAVSGSRPVTVTAIGCGLPGAGGAECVPASTTGSQ